jgi:SAM-dependent methyltransferase
MEMNERDLLQKVRDCFHQKLVASGPTPEGVYWNSVEAQEMRFSQLLKICDSTKPFSILDYGSGYGALIGYLMRHGYSFRYTGYDIVEEMIAAARKMFRDNAECTFSADEGTLTPADYTVASGIFNMKLDVDQAPWTEYIVETLEKMNRLSTRGFSFNLLTKYSDPDRMHPNLYYADPCYFFDLCKRKYARNVALLHDYGLYDFTILVRKELG